MRCFVAIQNYGWNSHTWSQGIVVGFSLCAVVLLVLLMLAVALVATRRHLLTTKCRWRRGRRRIDGSDHRSDPEQSISSDETCKRLLDPTAITPANSAITTACGGVEFYLKVVTPDSAGDNLSPSSVSSCDSEAKSEHRQLGDGSTCYNRDLVCATLKREILEATTGTAWNCELCQCDRSSSTAHTRDRPTERPPMMADKSAALNRGCGCTSYRDRRSAGIGPTAIDRTIPRCHVAAPCMRSRLAGNSRPRSWCSCMHVDNILYNDCCPSAIAKPCGFPKCCEITGNDRCHVSTLDRRCRQKSTTTSRSSLKTT